MIASVFTKTFLLLFSGPIIWAIHFLLIYGFTGVICARPAWKVSWLGIGIVEWGIGLAGLAALAVLGFIHTGRPRLQVSDANAAFVRWASLGLAMLAAVAIVWESLPVLLMPICA